MATLGSPPLPALGSKVSNSAVLGLTSGSLTLVDSTWDTLANSGVGEGGFWVAGTPSRMTVRRDGWHMVTLYLAFAANGTGYRRGQILKNGATTIAGDYWATTATLFTGMTFTAAEYLVAGDYVQAYAAQLSGGALNLAAGSSFAMVRLA